MIISIIKKLLTAIIVMELFFMSCDVKSEHEEGWQDLLANNNTALWHTYGQNKATKAWVVEDNILFFKPTEGEGGSLSTNEDYENFHLKLEWKISQNGNSGILFLVHEDTAKYKQPTFTGPEMQILDNNGHDDGKILGHRSGDLYDLIPSFKETVNVEGEWNKAEIILKNAKLEFYLNGEKIVSTTMWDANWDKMVANSKFKNMPDYAKYRKGKIVLQDRGDEVWFRNIKIKKL